MTQVFQLLPLLDEASGKRDVGTKPRKKHVGSGNHGRSKRKLSDAQAAEIMRRFNGRADTTKRLAAEFSVSIYTVLNIGYGLNRKYILLKPLTAK